MGIAPATSATYAVIWRRRKGPLYAGRLVLDDGALRMEGTAPGRRRVLLGQIPFDLIESATVMRDRNARLRGLPTLTLEVRGAAPIQIATIDGPGKLSELAATMTSRLVSKAVT